MNHAKPRTHPSLVGVWKAPVNKVRELLRQGTAPRELALATTLGLVLGITPVLGSTTLLCAGAAALLRLNLPAIQMVNALAYPLQLALLIPFLKLGDRWFGTGEFDLPLAELVDMIESDPLGAISHLWTATIRGLAAWLVTAGAAVAPVYFALRALASRLVVS